MPRIEVEIPEQMEAAFYLFLVDCTERVAANRATAVWGMRAAFEMYLRANKLGRKPTTPQFNKLMWLAEIPVQRIPTRRGLEILHACGIRLKGKYAGE